MPSNYQITEPHPSVPRSNYIHAGRGGAGNIAHIDPRSVTSGPNASGPASRTTLAAHPSNSYFMAGRGGAGNAHREKERAIFSFDEELERQRRMMEHQTPVYHIGRGGAGNLMDERTPSKARTHSPSSADSVDSEGSRARRSVESAWNRVRGSITK